MLLAVHKHTCTDISAIYSAFCALIKNAAVCVCRADSHLCQSVCVQCANIVNGCPEPRGTVRVPGRQCGVAGGSWEPIIVRQPGLNGVWQS